MDIGKYSEKAIEKLRKAGKAILIFTVEKHPRDTRFKTASPSIDLYIVPCNKDEKEPPEDLPRNCYKGTISVNTEKSERTFEVQAESITGLISRTWHNLTKEWKGNNGMTKKKKRAEPIDVWIVADPHDHWKESYQRTFYRRELNAGPPLPLIVSLKPNSNAENEFA